MGNCYMKYCPEELQTAENMARVCRMRKQVLGKQHAEILIKAKEAKSKGGANKSSLRPMALQLKQMRQQMNKLEEVEMNFINIASISQTTGALQTITEQYNTAHDSRENVDIDEVLDLQDALREQQETFAEIDKALAESWTPLDDLYPSGGGPQSGSGTSRESQLELELEGYIEEQRVLSLPEQTSQEKESPPEEPANSSKNETDVKLESLPSPPSFKDSTPIKSTSVPKTSKVAMHAISLVCPGLTYLFFLRVFGATGAFLCVALAVPALLLVTHLILERHVPLASNLNRGSAIAIVLSFMGTMLFLFFYWAFTAFGPFHRHGIAPTWSSPRLTLFMELNPLFGWLVPITAFLRGHILVAFIRWSLNFAVVSIFAFGEGILKPNYLKACCYGKDTLDGDEFGGHCDNPSLHSLKGFFVCDEDGHSDEHKELNKWMYCFLALSATIQLVNITMIEFDVVERVERMVTDIRDRKLLTNIDCNDGDKCTINLSLIFERMGMPRHLLLMIFPGLEDEEAFYGRSRRVHRHPHWAHPGLYRLLCLDPIFGLVLSVQDFVGFSDLRGITRIIFNVLGSFAIFLSMDVLQPMHKAWCCYGTGRDLKDENINGTHFTCHQWIEYFDRNNDPRIKDVFTDSELFPNGSCMQYDSFGLLAAWCFAVGVTLLVASLSLWVFGFIAAEDACEHAARRLFRDTKPSERYALVQAMDYLGIKHGKVKFLKNS